MKQSPPPGDSSGSAEARPTPAWLAGDFWSARRLGIATLLVAVVVLLVWKGAPLVSTVLRQLRDVIVTLVLAIVLAYIVAPLVEAFCRFPPFSKGRAGRTWGALLAFLVVGLGLAALLSLTARPIVNETARLVRQASVWPKELPDQTAQWLQDHAVRIPAEWDSIVKERLSEWATTIVEWLVEWQFNLVRVLLLKGWTLIEALVIPVLSFYFVIDGPQLRRSLLDLLPRRYEQRVLAATEDIDQVLHNYVRGQLLLCAIAAVVTAGGLSLLGVKVFLTLGLLAGLSRAIPVIGPIVMVAPLTLGCLIPPAGGLRTALIAVLGFGALNLVESKLVMPKLIGLESRLHPLVVITALLVGGKLAGILGMLIAVPIVAVLRVVVLHWRPELASREEAAVAAG